MRLAESFAAAASEGRVDVVAGSKGVCSAAVRVVGWLAVREARLRSEGARRSYLVARWGAAGWAGRWAKSIERRRLAPRDAPGTEESRKPMEGHRPAPQPQRRTRKVASLAEVERVVHGVSKVTGTCLPLSMASFLQMVVSLPNWPKFEDQKASEPKEQKFFLPHLTCFLSQVEKSLLS